MTEIASFDFKNFSMIILSSPSVFPKVLVAQTGPSSITFSIITFKRLSSILWQLPIISNHPTG